MKLYRAEQGWTERLLASATPSITLRSAVPLHRSRLKTNLEYIKIRLRALRHPRQTPHWLHLLNSHPALSEYVRSSPSFVYKVFRPYNTHALDADARLEAIRAHYEFVFRRGLGQTLAQASMVPVVLAEAAGKSGLPYQIRLRTVHWFNREGELVLQLTQDERTLYSVVFTVAPRDGRPTVNVGCIQGGNTEDAREAIRSATRELHGIRPKQLMATLVRQLGYEYGCERMVMVSNRNRVVYAAIRRGRVLADYDQLWTELGAQPRRDGDWELPCAPVAAPDLDAIPSKKRSEARKRHELVRRMADDVCVALRARTTA